MPQYEDFTRALVGLTPSERDKALQDLETFVKYGSPEELIPRVSNDPRLFMEVFLPDMMKDPKSGEIFPPASFHDELFRLARAAVLKDGEFENKLGLVVAAPRGGAKCLSGSTKVQMADGITKPLRDIVVGDQIVSLNQQTLKFEQDTIMAKVSSGRKPLLRVTTRTGKSLRLTAEHRVLTFDGWKTAGELLPTDRIASPRRIPVTASDFSHSDSEVKLIAYILAEGGLSSGNCSFTNADTLAPHEDWLKLEDADVFWDAILSITDDGEDETYDVQVGRNANLITDGLVTHNSTVLSLCIVLWAILCRHKTFVAIFSDTSPQAEYIGANIRRELEANEIIHLYFGDVSGLRVEGRKWTKTDFEIVFRDEDGTIEHEARVMVRGAGSSVRGLRVRNRRPDLIISDDMENDEDVRNLDLRDRREAWWNRVVMPMVDPKNVSVIVGGTMLHDDAVLSRLMDSSQFITRRWSCWKDGVDGQSYWPERFSNAFLLNIKNNDPVTFALEYLNDPKLTGIRPVKPENLLFYTGSQVYRNVFGEWMFKPSADMPEVALDIFGGVDPAISEEEEACDFAAVVVGITRDERHDVLVLRSVMAKIDFPSQVNTMMLFAKLFPEHRSFGFETAAYQRALPQQLKKQMKRNEIRITELPHIGGKIAKRMRIMKLAPLVEMRRLWFRSCEPDEEGLPDFTRRVRVYGMQWPLYEQVARWPNGKLQDGADALAMALETAGESGSGPLFGGVAADMRRREISSSLTDNDKVVYSSR